MSSKYEEVVEAVREYFGSDQYVTSFVLVAEITSTDLEREGATVVRVLCPPDQSFVQTTGLLSIAHTSVKRGD